MDTFFKKKKYVHNVDVTDNLGGHVGTMYFLGGVSLKVALHSDNFLLKPYQLVSAEGSVVIM